MSPYGIAAELNGRLRAVNCKRRGQHGVQSGGCFPGRVSDPGRDRIPTSFAAAGRDLASPPYEWAFQNPSGAAVGITRAKIHPCGFRVGDLCPGHGPHSWPDAAPERTQPRGDVALWYRRRAEEAQGISSERRSMGSGLGDFRHESHENPATELAGLRTIETLLRRAASVCPGVGLLRTYGGWNVGRKPNSAKNSVFSVRTGGLRLRHRPVSAARGHALARVCNPIRLSTSWGGDACPEGYGFFRP